MIRLVTYSEDPERRPRHVLAVANGPSLQVRRDVAWIEQLSSELARVDAARRLKELALVTRSADLGAWFASQGWNVSVKEIDSDCSPEHWFNHPLEPNDHYVHQISHVLRSSPPPGWFERVQAIAQRHAATADHPFEGNFSVRCLVRRPLLQAMSPEELATLRAEVHAALHALDQDRGAA